MKRSPLWVIFLTVFIDLLGFGIVLPLLPRYAAILQAGEAAKSERRDETEAASSLATGGTTSESKQLDLGKNAFIGILMASFSAMQFLFAPAWGKLSDRIGRRPVLIIGLASSTVCYALFGYATHISSLMLVLVSRIGAGIAGATIPTAQAFIADSTTDAERGKGMALIGAAFGIGFTFGPLIGSIWVSNDPTAAPSAAPGVVASLLSFIAFCLAVAILPESLRPGTVPRERRWLDFGAIQRALAVPTVGILLATFFVATFAFANFEATLSRLTKDAFDFSDKDNFYLFAYIGFTLTLAQGLLVRRMMPRVGEVSMAIGGTVLMAVGLLGLGWSAVQVSQPIVLAMLPVAVVGFACLTPSLQSLISRRTAADTQGEVLGVAQSASSLARILGPFLGNVLYGISLFGPATPHATPYFFGAAVMALAFLLSLGIGRGP